MSKSLGNVLSLEALTRDYPAVGVRWALSSVHHRSTIEWGDDTLPTAMAAWTRFSSFIVRSIDLIGEVSAEEIALAPAELPQAFSAALNDDLNIAGALSIAYEHLKLGNIALEESARKEVRRQHILVRSMLDIFGLDPASQQWRGELGIGNSGGREKAALSALVEEIIHERAAARAEKDWARADLLRDRLASAGILLEDGREGASWHLE